ncbi:chemotaxis protein CheW [Sediminicurvatus halobius]|uniref:Chemotaxis protein CheW n=1 Tax=Sediminicurvatus halobius TaxID=2182432 RepID=A0A2U2N3X7_9GAMM|nr:chemotaxis protein CheW [Spiribacter halobius]PWG63669.1 chemotaxis protein CheW [Spiribacter halobius]UEX79808.1 chemotaxis protein CheW [Spiribacter halobius]
MAEQQAARVEDATTQWVTFKLDDEVYGINVMQVQEVLPMTEIAPVPGAPPYVMGIINLRGNVVTVIDTRMRFGLEQKTPEDGDRIMVVETEDQVAGIVVDGVAEVTYVRESEVDTAPNVGNDDAARYIWGVVSREDSLTILVDVNRLLTRDEWEEVAAL